jgi:hypothetical protein
MDRARSKRIGPDTSILLRGPDGHLHLMQRVLANGRAFLLFAAVLTVTQTCRKRNWSPCSRQRPHLDAGIADHANPRPASDPTPFPVRRAGPRQACQDWPRAGADRTKRRSAGWCLAEYLNTQNGDISRV